MVASVLVPLDRSPLSEQALRVAVDLAGRAGASLEVVQVHRSTVLDDPHAEQAWMLKLDPEADAEVRRQEEAWLAEATERATAGTAVTPHTQVLSGSVVDAFAIAETILRAAEGVHADLIVMTTRARSLVTRVGLGSVADEVVRRSHVPVLLIPPSKDEAEAVRAPALKEILVPLDGSALSEQILEPALGLARLTGARCTLLRVVLGKGGDQALADAEGYLERVAQAPRQGGLTVETRVVAAKNPGDAILDAAASLDADLIALATRGLGGFKRLVLGSVADTLVQRAGRPLMVRCPEPTA